MGHRTLGAGLLAIIAAGALAACSSTPTNPIAAAESGVIFSFPSDGAIDVPVGTRLVVTFSDPVVADVLGPCTVSGTSVTGGLCLVGPAGPVTATAAVVGTNGTSVQFADAVLDPGTTYSIYVGADLAPTARNLPTAGTPLVTFTTRTTRPRTAAPTITGVNGVAFTNSDTTTISIDQTATIRVLFSEPLDPRTVTSANVALSAAGSAVPATVLTDGIHISVDPATDLTAGTAYTLTLNHLADLTGQALPSTILNFTAVDSTGGAAIHQVLRTRQTGDPGAETSRAGAPDNVVSINKPLIGLETSTISPGAIAAELGDPTALAGPISFTIRRGQRLSSTGLDIKLGGNIPSGLSTGDIFFEFLTDSGGRLFRNPFHTADQIPDNDKSPIYVDLTFDIGVFSVDPKGNAVLTQTILGVHATGTAVATDGVLDIETVGALELGLLGVTVAPANLVLEFITDASGTQPTPDTIPPTLIASAPGDGTTSQPVGDGIDLIFSEPINLDAARGSAGIVLENSSGSAVPTELESHGASVVLRPLAPLAYNTTYAVKLLGVMDNAGNALVGTPTVGFSTPDFVGTGISTTVVAVKPGVPCVLTGGTATSPGRCAGGMSSDDLYQPFVLPANEDVIAQFSAGINPSTVVLGTACNTGTVRIEELDDTGACTAAVPGSLRVHERDIAFTPDVPFTSGATYRLTLEEGGQSCAAGDICGISGQDANFDPLNGTTDSSGGGSPLVMTFTAADATDAIPMVATTTPYTDINASGYVEGGEVTQDTNRAALNLVDYGGALTSASFAGSDCLPDLDGLQPCQYLLGAMPVEMHDLQMNCLLPDGTMAASCVPVTASVSTLYGTSVELDAAIGFTFHNQTGTTIYRTREPAAGPVTGFIFDNNGSPQMEIGIEIYMDEPDLDITLASHDLHSKPLTLLLAGPVNFTSDGRISIPLANTADIPVTVNIQTDVFLKGHVDLAVPMGEMHLTLVSPPLRNGAP